MSGLRLTVLDRQFAQLAAARGYVASDDLDRALHTLRQSRGVGEGRDILPKIVYEMDLMAWDEIDAVFREMFGDLKDPQRELGRAVFSPR